MNLKKLADLEDVSIDLNAEHPETGDKVNEAFCAGWPVAKNSLELIHAAVKNPILKMIINIVITVGEGIEKKVCGN